MIEKVLIANRGEIALRIQRACRSLNIRTVAVYSEVDREALFVKKADESVCLGAAAPKESYLNIPKIIEAAQKTGAQAIHPGYGFLSERPEFAQACEKAGIIFIGPTSDVIKTMGDKIGAKKVLEKENVPMIPGLAKPLTDLAELKSAAQKIGFPVLLKAAAGGGGKGMQVVHTEADLESALASCQRVAKSAFGDDRIFMEKYLLSPRHVEFQVVGDTHGNFFHLFERECSVQRRHQKIIEETPSPALDSELRSKMADVAVRITKAIGYRGVGTIEFILDAQKNFYFLEMNTRLQVEHPITEMVVGVDLVQMQIRIARGEIVGSGSSLPASAELAITNRSDSPRSLQETSASNYSQSGHAIECRICAEDPEKNFLPSIGKITRYVEPKGEGVRVDSGVFEGWTIPMEYDPMLAKLIVHAPSRSRAIMKMLKALDDYQIEGIKTNIPFLMDILRNPEFVAGRTETGLIEKHFKEWSASHFVPEDPFNPFKNVGAQFIAPSSQQASKRSKQKKDDHNLTAPMPGQVVKVLVQEGQSVKAGEMLVVMEAMKMEHSISAPKDSKVKKVNFQQGDKVNMGDKLVELE